MVNLLEDKHDQRKQAYPDPDMFSFVLNFHCTKFPFKCQLRRRLLANARILEREKTVKGLIKDNDVKNTKPKNIACAKNCNLCALSRLKIHTRLLFILFETLAKNSLLQYLPSPDSASKKQSICTNEQIKWISDQQTKRLKLLCEWWPPQARAHFNTKEAQKPNTRAHPNKALG